MSLLKTDFKKAPVRLHNLGNDKHSPRFAFLKFTIVKLTFNLILCWPYVDQICKLSINCVCELCVTTRSSVASAVLYTVQAVPVQ